ncbi:hypothetical protein FZEAL_2739 [Fusarium zealandicum]|uniref:Uncharacterized protein n=1 Tax=Fusarium zealandicum TaxID=1053134 RepID=A0A8H4XMH3_9HYPO|nr:hypothetical protein FZEAL_2739 [Fusarium zealandicum]
MEFQAHSKMHAYLRPLPLRSCNSVYHPLFFSQRHRDHRPRVLDLSWRSNFVFATHLPMSHVSKPMLCSPRASALAAPPNTVAPIAAAPAPRVATPVATSPIVASPMPAEPVPVVAAPITACLKSPQPTTPLGQMPYQGPEIPRYSPGQLLAKATRDQGTRKRTAREIFEDRMKAQREDERERTRQLELMMQNNPSMYILLAVFGYVVVGSIMSFWMGMLGLTGPQRMPYSY